LIIRLPEKARADPDAFVKSRGRPPSGERIPLSRLATIEKVQGPNTIKRDWYQRRITIEANVRGRDLGSFVAEAQQVISQKVQLPAGRYRIEWGGQFENLQRAQTRLMIVVPIALLMILSLLYMTYRNWVDSFRVFTGVPFAWIGGVLHFGFATCRFQSRRPSVSLPCPASPFSTTCCWSPRFGSCVAKDVRSMMRSKKQQ
jgi:cobalt-zinc-cadmium resistance protein CzcA